MSRHLTIAAVQMGPVQLGDSRDDVVERPLVMLRQYRLAEAHQRITSRRGVIPPHEETT